MTAERGTPARLAIDHPDPVQVARQLLATRLALRRDFAAVIGDGSDLLLAAFILQTEGACVTAVALEALLGGPKRIVRRWLAALASEGLVRPIDD